MCIPNTSKTVHVKCKIRLAFLRLKVYPLLNTPVNVEKRARLYIKRELTVFDVLGMNDDRSDMCIPWLAPAFLHRPGDLTMGKLLSVPILDWLKLLYKPTQKKSSVPRIA